MHLLAYPLSLVDVPHVEYIDAGPAGQSEQDAEAAKPLRTALIREPVESRGMILGGVSPFAGVPVFAPDPGDDEVGPPLDPHDTALRTPVELREGPWSLLVSTALQGAAPDQAPLVEDALLRRSDAALSADLQRRLRPLADQVALLESEYLTASSKYSLAEAQVPSKDDWHNPQHLLEAMKVHERRMDRLQRGMRDVHDRLVRSVQLLDRARLGGDLGGVPDTGRTAVGVEVTQSGDGTSRVRVGAR